MQDSEDLKFLKETPHPCGHFETALQEIEVRNDRIFKLETSLKMLILHTETYNLVVDQMAQAIQGQKPQMIIQMHEKKEQDAANALAKSLREAKELV